jgi:YgiT-type zinc finger domain-containing protein
MKCSIQGCPGEYEHRFIVHTVKHGSEVFVFENVPAEVCDVCSDVLLEPETIRHIEELMRKKQKPSKIAPVYTYS